MLQDFIQRRRSGAGQADTQERVQQRPGKRWYASPRGAHVVSSPGCHHNERGDTHFEELRIIAQEGMSGGNGRKSAFRDGKHSCFGLLLREGLGGAHAAVATSRLVAAS